jgi:hypothetical protein
MKVIMKVIRKEFLTQYATSSQNLKSLKPSRTQPVRAGCSLRIDDVGGNYNNIIKFEEVDKIVKNMEFKKAGGGDGIHPFKN